MIGVRRACRLNCTFILIVLYNDCPCIYNCHVLYIGLWFSSLSLSLSPFIRQDWRKAKYRRRRDHLSSNKPYQCSQGKECELSLHTQGHHFVENCLFSVDSILSSAQVAAAIASSSRQLTEEGGKHNIFILFPISHCKIYNLYTLCQLPSWVLISPRRRNHNLSSGISN